MFVDPQQEICFTSAFWRLKRGGDSHVSGKFVHPLFHDRYRRISGGK